MKGKRPTMIGQRVRINSPESIFHEKLGEVVQEDHPRHLFPFGVKLDGASEIKSPDGITWFAYTELDWPIAPSSNGKTSALEADNLGSTPSGAPK
jgi:hypothetical protein